MIRTSYDPEADAFYAQFAPEGVAITSTEEVAPGMTLDLDASGQTIGIEILSVKTRGAGAQASEAAIAAQ